MLNRERQEQAIAWVIRLRDGAAQDWEDFTSWLEADPANGPAYEEAALADQDMAAILPRESAAGPAAPLLAPAAATYVATPDHRRHSRRSILGWGIAASIVAVTTYGLIGRSAVEAIETAPGEHRQLALGDGSRIEINGGSRLLLDRSRPRFARLEKGEALFRIVHDPARPFEVETGDALLRDMGTVFNVVRDGGNLEVAVSEGAVLYNPGREARNLAAGMALHETKDSGLSVAAVDPQTIGSWNEGRLVYSTTPVSRVAADLSRNLGLRVTASAGIATRPFSGIIILDGARPQALKRAASLLGANVRKNRDAWILEPGTSASP